MSEALYGRRVEVIVGLQGKPGYSLVSASPLLSMEPAYRIDFAVTDAVGDGKPAQAVVTICNPPKRLVADLLTGEKAFISIAAGYGDRAGLLFAGKPLRDGVEFSRESADTKLKITAMTGGTAYRDTYSTISLNSNAVVVSLVEQLCKEMGFTIVKNDIPTSLTYPRGFSHAGTAASALSRLSRYAKVHMSISATGEVRFLDPNNDQVLASSQEKVPLFSSITGTLIGMVSKTDKGTKFRGLLISGLSPGKQVVLEHYDALGRSLVRSTLVLRDVKYDGSTEKKNFYVTCVGRVVKSERVVT
tara:strand:- start:92 stop:997 length:906 start_codon:yes stop_codon:yes gene_type:complete